MEHTLLIVLFTGVFFVLGVLYKIISDFKKEMIKKLHDLETMFYKHIACHKNPTEKNREPIK